MHGGGEVQGVCKGEGDKAMSKIWILVSIHEDDEQDGAPERILGIYASEKGAKSLATFAVRPPTESKTNFGSRSFTSVRKLAGLRPSEPSCLIDPAKIPDQERSSETARQSHARSVEPKATVGSHLLIAALYTFAAARIACRLWHARNGPSLLAQQKSEKDGKPDPGEEPNSHQGRRLYSWDPRA